MATVGLGPDSAFKAAPSSAELFRLCDDRDMLAALERFRLAHVRLPAQP